MNEVSRRDKKALAWIAILAALLAATGALVMVDTDGGSDADGASPAICRIEIDPGNHGSGTPLKWDVLSGNSVCLPAAAFEPTDPGVHYLAGFSESNGGAVKYAPGQRVIVTKDMNLWAVWSSAPNHGPHDTVEYGFTAPSSATTSEVYTFQPIKDGKTTMGYDTGWVFFQEAWDSYGVVVDDHPEWMTVTKDSKDLIFRGSPTGPGVYFVQAHAKSAGTIGGDTADWYIWWTITVKAPSDTTHKLMFHNGGGSGAYFVPAGAEGTCTVLPSSGFTKTGYTLAAWSTPISGQTVYYPLSAVYTFTDHDAVMTAFYMPDVGVLVFDAAGGVSASGAQAYLVQSGGVVTLPSTGYTMPGHTLLGWRYSNEPDGAVHAPGYQVAVVAATPSNAMSAVWADSATVLHKITFDPNGGQGTTTAAGSSISVPSGTKVALPSVGLIKSGFTLHGWNTKADGSGDAYSLGGAYSAGSSDATVYAVWKVSEASDLHTVSFLLNGGRGTIPSQAVPSGSTASKPADPTMDGYVFAGWQAVGATGYFDFSTAITSDIVLRAMWQRAVQVSVEGLLVTVTLDPGAPGGGHARILWGDGSEEVDFYRTTHRTMSPGASGDLTVTLKSGQKVTSHWAVAKAASGDCKVTILDDDGKVLKTYTVPSGKELSKSSVMKDLSKTGKTVRVYTDTGHDHEYGWGMVTSDLTLHAHYTSKAAGGSDTIALATAVCCILCVLGFVCTKNIAVLALAIALGAAAAMMWVML